MIQNKELAGWQHPNSYSQCLKIQEETSKKWCPSRDQILFNTFKNGIDSGMECTLSRFADCTKLSGAVDMLEGKDDNQGVLASLEESSSRSSAWS